MKILVIGQTSSFWIREYVSRVLNKKDDEVYLLYDEHYGQKVKDSYTGNNVHFIDTSRGVPIIGRIPKVRTPINLYVKIRKIAKEKKFDVIEFQGMPVSPVIKFISKFILSFADRTVCMYWGSDLLASSRKQIMYSKDCLDKAKYIIFDSDNLKKKFWEIFGNQYDDKFVGTRLGTTIFDDMNRSFEDYTREYCRSFYGIEKDQTVITIGYNGRKRQQHMKVLEQLVKLDESTKKKITILIHIGYGLESEEYKQEIEEFLSENFERYILLDEFLDKEKIAMLRRAVDIFIHAQISDALAGSVKEYLYAGAVLINPKWIEYSECKNAGIEYYEYERWEELPKLVIEAMNCEFDRSKNRKLLYDIFSWPALINDWDKVHTE